MSTPYNTPSVSRYLDGRVMSASQPELQQMLLDGALRFARQALALWNVDTESLERDRLLDRALAIGEQLVASVAGRGAESSKRLEEEYAFIYRQLAVSKVTLDAEALNAAIRVIEFQRETWRLACEKVKAAQPAPAPNLDFGSVPTSGFSFQA